MFGRIRNIYSKYKLSRKKKRWVESNNVLFAEPFVIFEDTNINAHLGSISFGEMCCVRASLEIQRPGGKITVGNNVYLGDNTRIWAADEIVIGNNVLIAHNCNIFDNDTHPVDYMQRRQDADNIIWKGGKRESFSTLACKKIEIKDDAWIGANVSIMKGVTIGERTIVATSSVVTKSFPSDVVVAGNPARIVKNLSSKGEKIIEKNKP